MENSSTPTAKQLKSGEDDKGVGNTLNDFKILCELGRGSYGVVNKVLSLVDSKEYVMKKINIKHIKIKHQKEALKEAQILRKVRHPNIIRYYNSFVEDEHLYIIMEYAEGGDLAVLIKAHKDKKKYFSEKDIWDFSWELCQAVDYLHNNNIIHRDIKTLNIFLSKDRRIKLGDLGVSKIVSSAASLQGTRVGTPLYLAPELVKQLPYDFKVQTLYPFDLKVDIWAVGCVLYHIAALEPPFYGDNLITLGYNIVHKVAKPLSNTYSPRLSTLIMKFLEKSPAARPKISEMTDIFPSRYRHPGRPQTAAPSSSGASGEHSSNFVEKLELYKGNVANLLKVDEPLKSDRQKSTPPKNSKTQMGIPSLTQMNPAPQRPSTSNGPKPTLDHIIDFKRPLNDIQMAKSLNEVQKISEGKNVKESTQSITDLPELKNIPGNKKSIDTESTAENRPKGFQSSVANPGGNDTTLSAKLVKDIDNAKKHKNVESDVIIEENFSQENKNNENHLADRHPPRLESLNIASDRRSPHMSPKAQVLYRPFTSDSKRLIMNPIIKSHSPRLPVKAKLNNVLHSKAIFESDLIDGNELYKLNNNPQSQNLHPPTHNDIRIRPVSAHIIKRPVIQAPKPEPDDEKVDDDNDSDNSVDDDLEKIQNENNKLLHKVASADRPKSAIFLNRFQNQIGRKVESVDFNHVKTPALIKNPMFSKDNQFDKIKIIVASSSGFDKNKRITQVKSSNLSAYGFDNLIEQNEEKFRSEEKKSQNWMKIESITKNKERDGPINFYRPETFGNFETKPDQPTYIRPTTSSGHKKKVTIHDLQS